MSSLDNTTHPHTICWIYCIQIQHIGGYNEQNLHLEMPTGTFLDVLTKSKNAFGFALKFPSELQHELSVILVCLNKCTPLKMHASHIHLERIFETFPSQFCASCYAQYTLGRSTSRERVVFYDKAVNQSERRTKYFQGVLSRAKAP